MLFVRINAFFSLLAALVLTTAARGSTYDVAVLADRPVLYLAMSAPSQSAGERDLSGGRSGVYYPRGKARARTRLPNGDAAVVFDGFTQYLEVPSSAGLSLRAGGALTLEAWIRPDTLEFPSQEGDGYVHWLGKGESGQHEYACRMYSRTNTASPPRPNRISGYAFNPSGGLGSGSYFQDRVQAGEWIHVAMIVDMRTANGTVSLFKNGVLRKTTPLSQFNVTPAPGDAPLRIATRDMRSFFKGAIGKVALYPRALSAARLRAHVEKMR